MAVRYQDCEVDPPNLPDRCPPFGVYVDQDQRAGEQYRGRVVVTVSDGIAVVYCGSSLVSEFGQAEEDYCYAVLDRRLALPVAVNDLPRTTSRFALALLP